MMTKYQKIGLAILISSVGLMILILNTGRTIEVKNEVPGILSFIGRRIVTAYTLGRAEENDNDPCIGAFNHDLCRMAQDGYTICASREFEKGTLLKVSEIECLVLDKTNARYSHRVDVAMTDYRQAVEFGKKDLPVAVIGKIPMADIEQYLQRKNGK